MTTKNLKIAPPYFRPLTSYRQKLTKIAQRGQFTTVWKPCNRISCQITNISNIILLKKLKRIKVNNKVNTSVIKKTIKKQL